VNTLKIALVQQSCDENRDVNLAKSIESIRSASAMGAGLVVLQELHAGLYFCQCEDPANFDQAEAIPGPTTDIFCEQAKEFGVVIVTSLFERRAPGLYHNTAVVFDSDGSIAGKYRKMHIPDDPAYYEKFYFTPGDLGFSPVKTSIGTLGVLVCWDQWYPEAARLMSLAGAELLIFPTAIGWDPNDPDEEKMRQKEAWMTIQRAHGVANGIPVVSVNRTGFEPDPAALGPGIDFWGGSFVAGPQGELLAQAGADEEVLIVEIDRERSETVRRIWPFLRDRRIDAYGDLLKRYRD
jgi:N-carbamoylputrescine amidase